MKKDTNSVENIISFLFNYYMNDPEQIFDIYAIGEDYDPEELVKDHIASMTDRYAINVYNKLTGRE